MAAPDPRHQKLETFIREAFPLDKVAGKALAPGGEADQTAASADVIAFLQSQPVLGITDRYLAELRALWLCSPYGQPVWLGGEEISQVSAELFQTEAEPQSLAPMASPAACDLLVHTPECNPEDSVPPASPLKSEIPLDNLSPPDSSPAMVPLVRPADPRIRFHLPNAKAGQLYAGKLEGRDANGKAVRILDATADPATSLSFDVLSSELRGTPTRDGDFPIAIRWTFDGVAEHIGECLLFVNPDPRSLWKHIDPPAGDPYFKPNTEAELVQGPASASQWFCLRVWLVAPAAWKKPPSRN